MTILQITHAKALALTITLATITGCDTTISSVIPGELQTVTCVIDVVPDVIAVLDDAIADTETQANKVAAGELLTPADVDGTTTVVNLATRVRECMRAK